MSFRVCIIPLQLHIYQSLSAVAFSMKMSNFQKLSTENTISASFPQGRMIRKTELASTASVLIQHSSTSLPEGAADPLRVCVHVLFQRVTHCSVQTTPSRTEPSAVTYSRELWGKRITKTRLRHVIKHVLIAGMDYNDKTIHLSIHLCLFCLFLSIYLSFPFHPSCFLLSILLSIFLS